MKYLLLPILLVLSFSSVSAQSVQVTNPNTPPGVSISGDDLCGSSTSTKCKPSDFKKLVSGALKIFIIVGGSILVAYVALMLVKSWFAYRSGNAAAIKQAGARAFNAFIGFILVVAVFGGLYAALLKTFGAQPWVTAFLKYFSEALVPHAYAAGNSSGFFPNPAQGTTLTDLVLAGMRLLLRFFVFPAIVAMWVWSGFQFVYSRGNPEGLKKAKSWLLYAVIITIAVFSLQGFLQAFIGTANTIVGQDVTSQSSGSDAGAPGSSCQENGYYGQVGSDGKCYVSSRGGSTGSTASPSSECETIASEVQRDSCFAARAQLAGQGCMLNGSTGQIGTDGKCYVGGGR